jgi:hypothetical protein
LYEKNAKVLDNLKDNKEIILITEAQSIILPGNMLEVRGPMIKDGDE